MIPIARPAITQAEMDAVMEVMKSGMLTEGEKVRKFEQAFARYCGTRHGIAVNSGTAALHTALAALGIGSGDQVIVPAYTFFSTASAVNMCGATPVFVDVHEKTFNIDPEAIRHRITGRTKAIIGVHLFGLPCRADHIKELCFSHDLHFIEDGAQAHGSTYFGKKVGSLGDIACFSFYATKNLCTGEGGMVLTNDDGVAEWCREFRNHGQKTKYEHTSLGYNYRMTDIAAAMGLIQLEKLDAMNEVRRRYASYYDFDLLNINAIETPYVPKGLMHVYHQYVLKISRKSKLSRDHLMEKLNRDGIGAVVHYPKPLNKQPFYNTGIHCPVSQKLCTMALSIPVHPGITEEERAYVAQKIVEVL